MICPHCLTKHPVSAHFCPNCGQPVLHNSPEDRERYARLAASAPAQFVEKVRAASHLSGERRLVTSLYLDIVDSTGLNARLGTVLWSEILNQALDMFSEAIYRYEGTIVHVQDDELLAFFGAPVAHEDDPIRAVRAALEILKFVQRFDQEILQQYQEHFLVRISLSTGPVTLGPVESDLSFDYSALGGTLSLFAHLEATRTPMRVLVTEETYRLVAHFFDCTDLGWQKAVGYEQAIHVFCVDHPKATPGSGRGVEGLSSLMIGRQTELQTLLQTSQVVTAGLGRVVIIQGEPGLGKTRLVSEWKKSFHSSDNPPLFWIEGRCLPYGQRAAYHLLQSLLRGIIGVRETADEHEISLALKRLFKEIEKGTEQTDRTEMGQEVYPYLAFLLSVKLDGSLQEQIRLLEPQALRMQIQRALRKLLIALAARQPLVIVLEDLHWADPSSVECLTQLLPLASTEPILFCIVMRPERETPAMRLLNTARDTMGRRLVEITLNTLSASESQQLISNLLKISSLPSQVQKLIQDKAEGNPFFVEEVIRMLIDRGVILQADGEWQAPVQINELEIPSSLQSLLLARIDHLPEEIKQTLRIAAVIGRQFPVKVLEHVLKRVNSMELLDHLSQLETAGLIQVAPVTPKLEYLFRHTLVQDAAYTSLLDSDQRKLHLQVGETLETLYASQVIELSAPLAEHFEKAGDSQRALKYHRIAAERAASAYANQEAESHYRCAAELADIEEQQADLLAGLGEALFHQSQYLEAEQAWEEAIQLYRKLRNYDRAARLQARCARGVWFAGDTPRGLQICLEGLEIFQNEPESIGLAMLIHEAARASYFNGKPKSASHLCRQALKMAKRLKSIDVQADALTTLAILPDTPPEEALLSLLKAVELAEPAGLLHIASRALVNLGNITHSHLGDLQTAHIHFLHARELAHRRGALSEEIIPLVSAAAISLDLGDVQKAKGYLTDLQSLQQVLPDSNTIQISIRAIQASLLALQGEFEEALTLLQENIAESRQRGDLQNLVQSFQEFLWTLFELDHHFGVSDWNEADQILIELLATEIGGFEKKAHSLSQASILRSRQKKFPEAHHYLEMAQKEASEHKLPLTKIPVLQAESELAYAENRWSNALQSIEEMSKYCDFMGVFFWGRMQTLWAELLLNRAEPDDLENAQLRLQEAKANFEILGSHFYIEYTNFLFDTSRKKTHAQARDQKRAAQELRQAGELQGSFLPQEPPQLPGWQVTAEIQPARTISGDFYDFIPLSSGKLGIVIADVADKGIGAALFMTSTRTLLRAYVEEYPAHPEQALAAANHRITHDTHSGLFITLFYGVLDPTDGRLVYCNAGHNPPLLIHSDGHYQELVRTGYPVGIFEQATWTTDSAEIEPGSLLVMYTDGVTEAVNSQNGMFGTHRLLQATLSPARGTQATASQIHASILQALQDFRSGAPQEDDVTLVVLSRE